MNQLTSMNQLSNLGSKPSLKQLVYENLQNMIIRGELEPGSKLTEDELAQSMNISRAPIREALNMLERDGFTKIIPRKGAIVAEVTVKDARDIWKCRLALEPFAAREALPNIPREEMEAALAHLNELETHSYSFKDYVDSDLEVHALYTKHLDNEYLKSILHNLKAHSTRVRWVKEAKNAHSARSYDTILEHKAIVEAFLSGDGDLVYIRVREHLQKSADRLLDLED